MTDYGHGLKATGERNVQLDNSLLAMSEEQLQEEVDRLGGLVSTQEIRKLELETAERNLEEDKVNLTQVIKDGVVEKDQARKETEQLRIESKVLKANLVAVNKRRKTEDARAKALLRELIDLKDSYEDMVWARVDLEDLLRKLDRDLVIMKRKQEEVTKAAAATADIEVKLSALQKATAAKMQDVDRLSDYREAFRSRLQGLKISLHQHSMRRTAAATRLGGEADKLARKKHTSAAPRDAYMSAFDTVVTLAQQIEDARSSRLLFWRELELSVSEIRRRLSKNADERQDLTSYLRAHVARRRNVTGKIQKINNMLERYCQLMRSNKKFTSQDNAVLMQLTNDLEAPLVSIERLLNIRVIGFDQARMLEHVEHEVHSATCKRAILAAKARVLETSVKRAQQLLSDISQENRYIAQLLERRRR
jgi:hypothetical protein